MSDTNQESPETLNRAIANQDFFIPLENLSPPAEAPSASMRVMEGVQYGFLGSSILIADVAPGEGPPLHLHFTEEVQVLPKCRAEYLIGDKRFTVEGPGVVNIPANTPHTVVNIGEETVHVVTFFPSASYETNWKVLDPNPLLPE